MPPTLPGSVDARNKFEDLSGVDTASYSNPYDALIEACQNDPVTTLFFPFPPLMIGTFLASL
jgi:hypothetical protein